MGRGVLVNAVAPGLTGSELWKGKGGLADQTVAAGGAEDRRSAIAEAAARVPLGRFAEPEEMSYAVLFLASSESNFITGQVLSPNGGDTIVGI